MAQQQPGYMGHPGMSKGMSMGMGGVQGQMGASGMMYQAGGTGMMASNKAAAGGMGGRSNGSGAETTMPGGFF